MGSARAREGRPALADRIDDDHFARLARESETALRRHVGDDGRVAFASPAHIVSARRPVDPSP